MEAQENSPKSIMSVKQISDRLKQAKMDLDIFLNCHDIPKLLPEEDISKTHQTIDAILKDVPSQQRLKQMQQYPGSERSTTKRRILNDYKGDYETIKKAAQNFDNLKPESEKIYHLAASHNPEKIIHKTISEKHLCSSEIFYNDSLKIQRVEKNTISPSFFRQLKQQQQKETLQPGEPLLYLTLYDSLSGQKIFQYLCYGEQTLLQISREFYCIIAKLQEKEESHQINSYFLIEDNFYYSGPQVKKKIEEILKLSGQIHQLDSSQSHLTSVDMAKVKLKNLRIVFGRPYFYRHLEGCDHIVVFKDLKILSQNSPGDLVCKEKYPLTIFEGRMRRRKCEGCKTNFADCVSLNDPLKAGRHLYLCSQCRTNLYHKKNQDSGVFIKYLHD